MRSHRRLSRSDAMSAEPRKRWAARLGWLSDLEPEGDGVDRAEAAAGARFVRSSGSTPVLSG